MNWGDGGGGGFSSAFEATSCMSLEKSMYVCIGLGIGLGLRTMKVKRNPKSCIQLGCGYLIKIGLDRYIELTDFVF